MLCLYALVLKKTPSKWHPSAKTCRSLMLIINCILLNAFVVWCINCKNMHSMSNINKLWLNFIYFSFSDWSFTGAFPFIHGTGLIKQLNPFLGGYFIGGYQENCTKFPFHYNHRFKCVIPQHTHITLCTWDAVFHCYVSATDDKTSKMK
jgi:hypothetical protein